MSTDLKKELEEKYGRVLTIEVTVPCLETFIDKDIEYRFKIPTAADQDRLLTEMAKNRMKALTNLTMSAVITEDKEKLKADIQTYPGLPVTISEKLMKLLGFGDGFLKA